MSVFFKALTAIVLLFLPVYSFPIELDTVDITILNSSGRDVAAKVEIAKTMEQRSRGLMFRKHLPENRGMLFVFEREQQLYFWMKNTYIPLSIAYIDSQGVIVSILHMEPLQEKTYPSVYKSKYALEMKRGWFEKNNIIAGCRIKSIGRFSK